jgi:2-isopropylmalate synthase
MLLHFRRAGNAGQAGYLCSAPVCKDWGLVGANAFAHGGGIHQDGVLKDASTYEIMTPESIGLTAADRRMHMGKLSGRAALNAQLNELGYELEKEQLNRAFEIAKLLLGKKKELEEMDMRYIAESAINQTIVVESGNL